MPGAPKIQSLTLIDEEEELHWPPYIFMMQLDGRIKWWQFYNTRWNQHSLLQDAKAFQLAQNSNSQFKWQKAFKKLQNINKVVVSSQLSSQPPLSMP
jgi:hypothetical protein